MPPFLQNLFGSAGSQLGSLIWALLILLVGWIIALIIRNVLRRLLHRTQLDERLGKVFTDSGQEKLFDASHWIAQIVYYILLLFVFVGFFEALGLTRVSAPLNAFLSTIWGWLPSLLAAAVIVLAAWIVATLVRWLLRALFERINLDKRVASSADLGEDEKRPSIGHSIAEAAYWLIFLLFLPAFLGALGLQSLMEPVQGMIDQILSYLPNVLWAAAILLVGWFVARVIRQVVVSFLDAVGVDRFGEKVGLSKMMGDQTLSGLVGLIVYVLIMLVVLISALDALAIEAISEPAIAMLESILDAVPSIVAAIVVLIIAYFVAKLVSDLVASLLAGIGFDRLLVWLGLGEEPKEGQRTPSEIVGYVVLVIIMLLAVTAAAELLNFGSMTTYVSEILAFVSRIAVALVVFAIGLLLANLARKAIVAAGGHRRNLLGTVAWIAIVFFTGALALGQTGISESIVNLAFGLSLGALAIAAALAFGLGGQKVAARELESMVDAFRTEEEE
jgi:small-conductance mechanosensitive channel